MKLPVDLMFLSEYFVSAAHPVTLPYVGPFVKKIDGPILRQAIYKDKAAQFLDNGVS